MRPIQALMGWFMGQAIVDQEVLHRKIREGVHAARNSTTALVADAHLSVKQSNRIRVTADKAIARLEAAREGRAQCDD